MDFLKKMDTSPKNVLKMAGILFGGIFLLALVISVGKSMFGSFGRDSMQFSVAPIGGVRVGGNAMYSTAVQDSYMTKEMASYSGGDGATLSVRNISPSMPPIFYGGTVGNMAEAYEVTDYSATIETRNKENTCQTVLDLKALSYVIFENSNESDTNCNYRFKVEKDRVGEILAVIKGLDPRDLYENSYTIKEQVDDFTSQIEILENKKASIDETLKSAVAAYTEITRLATANQDTASLAKIIDSKIQIIQRLTSESTSINAQLEQLARAKTDQLDRIDYTYFSVNVYEDKFIDMGDIGDSWKQALKNFFQTVNRALQDATINVIAFFFILVPYLIYVFLILYIAKYAWRLARKIWKK
jgi:hypothetical protein